MYKSLFLLAVVLIMFVNSIVLALPKDVEFTVNPLVERIIERLITKGILKDINFNTRPIDYKKIIKAINRANRERSSGQIHISKLDFKMLNWLKKELQHKALDLTLNGRTAKNEMIDSAKFGFDGSLSVNWRLNENLVLYEYLLVDRFRDRYPKAGKSAEFRLQKWKFDYTADFQEAYAKIEFRKLKLLLGRHSVFWSPARFGALGISDNSPSFNMIMLSTELTSEKWGSFYLYTLSSVLDKMWNNQNRRYLANRYLSAHRLDWLFRERVEIGITEIILYGGDIRLPEPGYLNPIIPYYGIQYNSRYNDNSLFLADFSIRPVNNLRIYGELLIDDFRYVLYSNDPNDVGLTLGLSLATDFDFSAEYTRVNRWTYTHLVTENQFLHYGSVIGHQIGPDGDILTVESSKFLNENTRLALRYQLKRKGEATPEDRYRGEEYKDMGFPSGIVERTDKFTFEASHYPIEGFWANLNLSTARIKNKSHISGLSCWEKWFDLKIGYKF